jgi:KDO2-lipid IV(A) lauroyltransferase
VAEPLRRRLRARLLRAGAGLLARTPRRLLRLALGGAAGLAQYTLHGRRARANLRLAFGSALSAAEERRLARASLFHAGRLVGEWARMERPKGGAWIDAQVGVDETLEYLREAVASGPGAIIVTAHIGNWELLAARLRRLGFEGAVVGELRRDDSSYDWLRELRQRYDLHTLPQDGSPRDLLRVLRSGGIVGLLPDLEARRLDGAFLPFFGTPALTMTAPAALARAAGLPLIPVSCIATGATETEYALQVDTPLYLNPDLPRRDAVEDLSARLNQHFEGWIRAHPEQWPWYQPRWRTRPGTLEPRPLAERQRRQRTERAARRRTPDAETREEVGR